jgi:O-antigen/teichoic acid export membrane protein
MFTTPSTRSLEIVLIWWAAGGLLSIGFAAVSLLDLPWRTLRGYRPDWNSIFAGLRTARPFMLTAVGALVISYVDRFVIDQFVGREALGIYTFYSTVLIGLLSLGASISHQFLPKVISGYADGAKAYRASLRSFLRTLLIVALGTTVVSGVVMGPLLDALGLVAYASQISVFYTMLPGVFLRILADVPSYALYAARSDNYLLFCNLGTALVSTLLNVLLIPVLGLYGAALTGGISSAVLLLSLTLLAVSKMRDDRRESTVQASVGGPTDPDMLYP